MRLKINKETFDSLPPANLAHACFEPLVPPYQAGARACGETELAVYRKEFLQSLPQGQRALFLFFTWYDHAVRATPEFERITRHYLAAQIFGAVERAVAFFGDTEMLRLLETIEKTLSQDSQNKTAALYQRLQKIAPATLATIGAYIKENPADFVQWE